MLPACKCKCKCGELFTEDQRTKIWGDFWDMDYIRRRDWVVHNVKKVAKRSISNTQKVSMRENTLIWQLGHKIVCKTFFLHSIGYSSDTFVQFALKNTRQESGVIVGCEGDRRGRHPPQNKFNEEYNQRVNSHIESYRPQVSHYRREHAPNRRYLPSDLSVTKMHKHFIEAQQSETDKCSYAYYHSIFNSLNISFASPSNDLCTECFEHDRANSPLKEHICETSHECAGYI